MCLVEIAQHEKIFAYIQQRVCANKAARQLFCSSLLFCFRELNRFLEISVRDPLKILRVSRNSILETWFSNLENQNSILDSRKLPGSRIEFRVETVNLHLNGTVLSNSPLLQSCDFQKGSTREDVTLLKHSHLQSYRSVRPSYLCLRDRGNYKGSATCLITKASDSSCCHIPLICCSLLSQPRSIRYCFFTFSHLRNLKKMHSA